MEDEKIRVVSEDIVREAKDLFDRLDKDGDGVVDASDFLVAFPSLAPNESSSEQERNEALEKAKDMIDGVDTCGRCDVVVEGQMRFPEFLRILVHEGFFEEEAESEIAPGEEKEGPS